MANYAKIVWFESPEDMAASCEASRFVHETGRRFGIEQIGGPVLSSVKKLREGDMAHAKMVQDIMDKIEISELLTENVKMLEPAIVGYAPNVPAMLAGQPYDMFNLVETDNRAPNAPVRVFVHTAIWWSMSSADTVKRGAAIAAFIMAMQTVRTVELYTVSVSDYNSRQYGAVCKVASRPMDLARALFMLTSTGFARGLGWTKIADMMGCVEQIDFAFGGSTDDEYTAGMRDMLGLSPDDILINCAQRNTKQMFRDPVAWVNEMVTKHTQ